MIVNLEKKVIISEGYYSLTITLNEKIRQNVRFVGKGDYKQASDYVAYIIMDIIGRRPYIRWFRLQPEIYEVKTGPSRYGGLYRTLYNTNLHFHCLVKIDPEYRDKYENRLQSIQHRLGYYKNKMLYKYGDLLNVQMYMHKCMKYTPCLECYDKRYEKQFISRMYGVLTADNKHIKRKCQSKDITSYFQ